ncbi:MAG TPA: biopolymer transporter ExbD, partial [Opitutus sp.]|nr:biopolymer transporter ExbD [Opitutus sp.]
MNDIDLQALTAPKKARVEIIPLIDVIFFLLATFVLFTLSLNKIAAIDTPLPVGDGGERELHDTTVYIQASATGTFYWKEGRQNTSELISAAEIAPRLADYRRRVSNARVLIRGDDKAKFGATVSVLDAVRKAGIAKVSMETAV